MLLLVRLALGGETDVQHREREVDGEERSEDDRHHEIPGGILAHRVLRPVHDVNPTLHRDALEDREPRAEDVIEGRDAMVRCVVPDAPRTLRAPVPARFGPEPRVL